MRFASLGSGSRGNALVAEVGRTRVLLDCGFNVRETVLRLARLGIEPESLSGIVITHEHNDHVGGVARFAARYGIPVWMTHGTLRAAGAMGETRVSVFDPHQAFAVGDLRVEPFPVPHDAAEPVQYVLGDGARRLGVLTDIGEPTAHVAAVLDGCDALVLECNHDAGMLAGGPYSPHLKRRIAGRLGHLENGQTAELLSRLDRSRLHHLIAAHLSETNNTPDLARAALAGVLGCSPEWVGVAGQDSGFAWRDIG
ncbi:MAG TPA: MBL fold metallo-hydrolase [Burkholderiales bacterium]|nr:MBL fold metallo-hydrolase [Burkholderiales bacterium]